MNFHRIVNFPLNVAWSGWKTNTFDLQRFGWEISVEELVTHLNSIRIAIHHPEQGVYGISDMLTLNRGDLWDARGYYNYIEYLKTQTVNISAMSSRIKVNIFGGLDSFFPVDGTPHLLDSEIKDIEDYKIFRPLGKTNEIIIDPVDVNKAMDLILNLQSPKQKEIREKNRKEWRKFQREFKNSELRDIQYSENMKPKTEIVAQLITA